MWVGPGPSRAGRRRGGRRCAWSFWAPYVRDVTGQVAIGLPRLDEPPQRSPGARQPKPESCRRDVQHDGGLGRAEPVEDGESKRLLVDRAQCAPSCCDVNSGSDQIGGLTAAGHNSSSLGETNRERLLLAFAPSRVQEGMACHAEQPGARCRQVGGHVVQTPPRHEHHLADDVLGVSRMDSSTHEPQQVNMNSVKQRPKALIPTLRRNGGVHISSCRQPRKCVAMTSRSFLFVVLQGSAVQAEPPM